MKTHKLICILILIAFYTQDTFGKDFIRIGAAQDFQKKKVVHTFSFDFNRTEKIDEKTGSFLLFDKNDFYILPTSDVNIGEGVTSSENNILVQLNIGKAFYGKIWKSKDKLKTFLWNKAIEFNPSYNSDKLFNEKLSYGQLKFLLNFILARHNGAIEPIYVKTEHSIATGLFTNLGYRNSKTYDTDNLYSTFGILLDYKLRLLSSKNEENWVFRVTGNYYYIASDVSQLMNDKFGGIIKCSMDRLLFKNINLGLSYKYGNDNPNYKYVNTLELIAKIRIIDKADKKNGL